MFNLRQISSVAPIGDVVFGLIIVLVAVAVANLAIIPKLFSYNARLAKALLAVTVLGCSAAVITLATQPRQFYFVVGVYIVIFMLSGFSLAWHSIGWRQTTVRVLLGSIGMLVVLTIAHWIAYAPR